MERYPVGHRREGILAEGRVERVSRRGCSASRCRRRTASSIIRSSPTRDRCCGSPTRTRSRSTCGPRGCRDLNYPDLCVFDLDPSGGRSCRRPRRRDRAARSARPSWHCRRGSRPPARRASTSSSRSTARLTSDAVAAFANARRRAVRAPRGRSADPGVQQGGSPRPHLRRHRQERLQRDVRGGRTPCAPGAARRSRRRARGKKSSAATCTRGRSRCATCPIASRRSATLWADMRRRGRSLRQPLEKLRKQIGDGRETAEP